MVVGFFICIDGIMKTRNTKWTYFVKKAKKQAAKHHDLQLPRNTLKLAKKISPDLPINRKNGHWVTELKGPKAKAEEWQIKKLMDLRLEFDRIKGMRFHFAN